jgi:WD40 repeat protein
MLACTELVVGISDHIVGRVCNNDNTLLTSGDINAMLSAPPPPPAPSSSKKHSEAVVSVRYSPSLGLLASASADKSVFVYKSNLVDGSNHCSSSSSSGTMGPQFSSVLTGHELGLNDCRWFNEHILVTCSDDKTVKIWDIDSVSLIFSCCPSMLLLQVRLQSQQLTTLSGHGSFVHSLFVHAPTGLVFSGGIDGTLCIHDPRSSKLVLKCELAHSDVINSIDIGSSRRSAVQSLLTVTKITTQF